MTIPDIIIAIDGYSSTGKSSFAKLVASGFGFLYLDSGALYRGVTLFAQRMGLIGEDNVVSDALETALEGLDLHFSAEGKTCIGETWMPFHFQDGNCNWLTSFGLDTICATPEYKVCAVEVEKL